MADAVRHPLVCRRSYSKVVSTINDAHEGSRPVAILLMMISFLHAVAADEICRFPEFLQSYPAEGAIKPWTTRMWWLYLRHAPKWAEKQDIYVKNGQIWRYRENNLQTCENTHKKVYHKTNYGDCSERQLVYNRTCIHEAGFNTYRIIEYNADRTHRFTCMKFVERSSNVVQVYEGPLSNTNDPDLCDSAGLRLDEWPWTAPKNNEVSFCPFSGGFNFRTIRRLTNEDFCEEEWRRSRLDIECIKGDGMDFIAPRDSNCNPFLKQGDWKRLTCWVGWEHGDYVFLIASDEGSQPRYCLRFPRVQDGEFSVLVYFSVICPVEHDGKPHHGIEYYELRMFRRDKSSCNDEDDDKCREIITSPEMCVKDTIYAPHCPKTCGQCAMNAITDINHRRCLIEPTLYGEWRLIDTFGTADVTIDKDKAVFSHLGTFQCLDKDHKGRRYKMASLFDNGCSPRYTCMEFNRRNNNVLQYKLSRSRRDETAMDELCIFHDDLPPLLTTYRSVHFKNLILTNNLWPSYCGLQSSIPYNGTIRGLQCSGVISDWNEDKCNLLGTITLKSKTCQELNVPSEYQCIAFIQDDGVTLQQLLLTRSLDNRHIYNCWVLTSYASGGQMPWRVLYQLPTPQCSLTMEVDSFKARDYTAALSLDDRSRTKVCKPAEARHEHYNSKPKASDLPYAVPNQDAAADHETEVHVASYPSNTLPSAEPPFINDVNTDPPMWDIYGNGNIIIHGTVYQNAFFVALSLQIFNVSLWTILYR